jgi:tetratricopeptide (TPR) repeat protein
MGRFRWLEMGDDPGPIGAGQMAPAADLDEVACMAKAEQYFRTGRFESALQWYSRALRFAITIEEAWVGQVRCLVELQEYVEASIWADRALERFPESPDLLAAKAAALRHTRGMARAMEYSDAALAVKGKAVGCYPWIVRGELLLDSGGSRHAAERCFAKALELEGTDWFTHFLIGRALMGKGLYEQARQRLSAAASLVRGNPLLYCALGECYEQLGEVGAAIMTYSRAVEADPKCRRAKERLAALNRVGWLRRLLRRLRS